MTVASALMTLGGNPLEAAVLADGDGDGDGATVAAIKASSRIMR